MTTEVSISTQGRASPATTLEPISTANTTSPIQSYIYLLPFGAGQKYLAHGFAGKILGGWQVSGILSARTGTPLTFTGNNSLNLGSGGTTTLDQVAPVTVLGGINTGNLVVQHRSEFRQNGCRRDPGQ